ncbi:transmembrane protein 131-like isoform X3 [Limulus polyphemus]|uniref:Transmembrane protein 131-like isoform X3 n=1 Tax=Limulus polyphemus TaxID=6850 RepID=A0ABM1BJ79_LIMPO|nr:transmembrane protein 131-like isoform X3 [Limulus polyphemus]
MFEMTEKHLKDCNGSRNNKFLQPNYTVRRAFTARNMGELPVYIRGFDINGVPCSGFGFRVLNCQGFELRPNSSRKVDIAFTPDFTLSRVERTLNIHTSLGVGGLVLQYTLIATLPRRMLASCGQSLPRPSWEYIFYYLVVCITGLLVIVVMAMAYFEADSLLKSFSIVTTTLSMGNDCIPEKLASFNLDHVANSVENKQGSKIDTTSSSSSLSLEANKRYEGSSQRDGSSDALANGILHRSQRRGSNKQDPDIDGGPCKDIASVRYENGGKNLRNRSIRNKQDGKSTDGVIEESIDQSKANKKRKNSSRSWTSFFKDPFSFGSSSETEHKSNAATQTTKGTNTEKNLAKAPEDDETSCFRDWPKHISTESNGKSRVRQNSPKENSQTVIKSKWKKQTDISSVEEETSSTTTETSNAESDISEKDNRLPDVCVVSKPMKTPRNKSKGQDQSTTKSEFGGLSGGRSETFKDDDDFQISTKSRAHKKIKVPTEVFGGDVLRPSTLELPYKPKPVVVSTVNKEKRLQPDITKTNKILNRVKPKSRSITTLSDTDSSDLGKESPPPLWDDPRPLAGYDGFFDLAQQTETFVLHNRGSSSNEPNLTGSYRPPTYSAAVSGDLGLNKAKSKTLLAGDVGGISSRFPGPVGQKPVVVSKSSGPGVTNTNTIFPTNMWNSLNGVGSSHLLQERDVSSSGLSSWSSSHLTDKLVCSTGTSSTDLDGILGSDRLPHKEYVRALQIQRYQKMEEYHKLQALQNQTDWPMYVTPISNSLWDPGYTPRTDTWRSVVSSERDGCSLTSQTNGQPKTSNCLWSSLVDDNWNSVSSVWSTATDTSPSDPPLDLVNAALSVIEGDEKTTEKSDPPETPITPAPATNLSTGNFDPFRTLDSIWNPPLTSTETSSSPSSDTWSCFSLFSHTPSYCTS